jgi:hypothetical protein
MPRIPISYKIERLAEKGLSYYQISLALKVSHGMVRRRLIPGWREAELKKQSRQMKSIRRGEVGLTSYVLRVMVDSRANSKRYGYMPCLAPLDVVLLAWTGYCHVCGVENVWDNGSVGKLYLDHCHLTGAFRGWLCNPCNSTIGYARDSVVRLSDLMAYLSKEPIWSPKVATPRTYAPLATVPRCDFSPNGHTGHTHNQDTEDTEDSEDTEDD